MAINKTHVMALIAKEVQQIRADKSVLIVVFILPILLVLLYGSGLRLDVKPVSVALVSPQMENVISKEIAFTLAGSEYFEFTQVNNAIEARELMKRHEIDAYILLPSNLEQSIYHQDIQVMIVINGSSAPLATLARTYLEAVLQNSVNLKGLSRQVSYLTHGTSINLSTNLPNTYQSPLSTTSGGQDSTATSANTTTIGTNTAHTATSSAQTNALIAATSANTAAASAASLDTLLASQEAAAAAASSAASAYQPIQLSNRNWFNESNESTWYMMAGQLIGTVTMMAAFMSAIVIAREFERGTQLGLKATHVTAGEVLLAKFVAYYALSCIGTIAAVIFALIFYQLPFRGSVVLFIITYMVYLYVIVMMAFTISVGTQNQFLATQYATILSFLPSILLSGAVFDLRSIPTVISYIAHLLPPTYAVSSSKICILSGGSVDVLLRNILILLGFGLFFNTCAYRLLARHFKRNLPQASQIEPQQQLQLQLQKQPQPKSQDNKEA